MDNAEIVQNIMLVALKSADTAFLISDSEELKGYLEHLWTRNIVTDLPILTDDYAPVDYYILNIL